MLPGGEELVVGRVAAAEVEQPLPQLRARAEEAVELVPGVGVGVMVGGYAWGLGSEFGVRVKVGVRGWG